MNQPSTSTQAKVGGNPNQTDVPVSVFLKATILDVAYLETMVRHMLGQAGYPFVDRVVFVDPRVKFKGKYTDRPRQNRAALDKVLQRLFEDDVIDRVVEVDHRRSTVDEIMHRYYGDDAGRAGTHAATGGPIYATLFGMESVKTDLVLAMDADVFFYSDGVSWVKQGLDHMRADDNLWLMMSHPGPPAGPRGKSLRGPNLRNARWDDTRGLWLLQKVTTRYFLSDRRRWRGRIRFLAMGNGCAPLERCMSKTLEKHGGYRGMIGDLSSWHLHAHSHKPPFSEWAPAIARAVSEGRYPDLQAGEYDMRLDREPDRAAWAQLLGLPDPGPPMASARIASLARGLKRRLRRGAS